MSKTSSPALSQVISLLDDAAIQVRKLEQEAQVLLHEQGDADGSEANMRAKAELLRDLPDSVEDLLDGVPGDLADGIAARLERFAGSAAGSLAQGSVFWMTQLLYPEDYQDGQPNDLELFIAELAS